MRKLGIKTLDGKTLELINFRLGYAIRFCFMKYHGSILNACLTYGLVVAQSHCCCVHP